MKLQVRINSIKHINELDFYWQTQDYINLLDAFNYPDGSELKPEELREYLFMSISDYEPEEAAAIILDYKLSDHLNKGQIQNISNEMLIDKIAEEYADPSLHFDLFNINQLLYKAYNGRFPNTEASIIVFELTGKEPFEKNKEIVLKALAQGLKDHNLVSRLFEKQLVGEVAFSDAANAIWDIKELGDNQLQVTTSKYWIEKSDFVQAEYTANIVFHEEEE